MYELRSLKFLDLNSNQINAIDCEIGNLEKLESLLLFQNNLKELPAEIGQLEMLNTLWLGNNRLTRLPREITRLVRLDWNDENLSLSSNIEGNPLKKPPLDVCTRGIAAIAGYFDNMDNNTSSRD